MRSRARCYPHPVLQPVHPDTGEGDDVDGLFQGSSPAEYSPNKDTLILTIHFDISNNELAALIKAKRAQYTVHLECRSTRYRAAFSDANPDFTCDVPEGEIHGQVELCFLITARTPIPKYKNPGFHADYGNRHFTVQPGDVLAVASDKQFFVAKEKDAVRKLSSIFSILRDDQPKPAPMAIDLHGDKLTAHLPKTSHDLYNSLYRHRQDMNRVIHSMVIVPMLAVALEKIKAAKDPGEDFGESRWYHVLRKRLDTLGVDLNNSTQDACELAQQVLGSAFLHDGLKALHQNEEDPLSGDDDD
jgi:hypothetical protein